LNGFKHEIILSFVIQTTETQQYSFKKHFSSLPDCASFARTAKLKSFQLQRASPHDQGLCPWTPLGDPPQTPL